jgi:hypothetical protein
MASDTESQLTAVSNAVRSAQQENAALESRHETMTKILIFRNAMIDALQSDSKDAQASPPRNAF